MGGKLGGPDGFGELSDPGSAALVEAAARAWAESVDLEDRRRLEADVVAAARDALTDRVRGALARFSGSHAPSVDDAVHQTIVELPAILAAYGEGARANGGPARAGGFWSYLMSAARNVAFDLAKSSLRESEHLARLSRSHPSRLGRAPTTPSQSEMRCEVRDLLGAELARLDDVDQRILRRHAERADFAQIGRELGMARETVRDRYHACAARLRRVVERALGGDPFAPA
jgi:RNA polymerase sigma factor (sigma-70 family)